jgi:hypothetical protein
VQAASATNDVDEDADEEALLAEEATEEADVVEALLAEETEDALLTEETEDALLAEEEVARRTILPIWSAPHK